MCAQPHKGQDTVVRVTIDAGLSYARDEAALTMVQHMTVQALHMATAADTRMTSGAATLHNQPWVCSFHLQD